MGGVVGRRDRGGVKNRGKDVFVSPFWWSTVQPIDVVFTPITDGRLKKAEMRVDGRSASGKSDVPTAKPLLPSATRFVRPTGRRPESSALMRPFDLS